MSVLILVCVEVSMWVCVKQFERFKKVYVLILVCVEVSMWADMEKIELLEKLVEGLNPCLRGS